MHFPSFLPRCFSTLLISYCSQASGSDASEEQEMRDLLSLLDSQTELATKSRMNTDYIPGLASILYGDELLARGARTVWEALGLVPGISLGMEFTGEKQMLSRGVGHGYASGNVKILVDGVSLNSTLLGTANPALNIPIEQIERIEVIRGAGASVYGEYAYAGVVNILTKQASTGLHTHYEDDSHSGLGGYWYWHDSNNDLTASINISGLEGDGHDVEVEEDAWYHTGQRELSNAPGPTNEAKKYQGIFFNLKWQGWFASAKLLDDAYGDHFGINHFLPPADGRLASKQTYSSYRFGNQHKLTDTIHTEITFEILEHERDRDQLYIYPAGFITPYPIYLDSHYKERKYEIAADIYWRPNTQHEMFLTVKSTDTSIQEAGWEWPDLPFELSPNWIDTERERHIFTLIAQDQFRYSDAFTLTATLRYDDYSDLDNPTSPRLAGVWRVSPDNIIKLQYARSFRPPTFYELQNPGKGKVSLSAINSTEIAYIIKKNDWRSNFILFQSDLIDPIVFDEINFGGYINAENARLKGFEFEYQQRFGNNLKLDGNLSFVDAHFKDSGEDLPGGAEWLANLGIIWKPIENWSTSLQISYVGERSRANLDSRSSLSATTQYDLTIGHYGSIAGLKFLFGIKNLTDETVRYPQQLTTNFEGDAFLPYPDDYHRPGRRWWLSLNYDIQ
ncbi:TonB-dependent receptor [Candidatus Thiodiazotropha endoloripes]|nr:TonB-dependent receptor [Candidatus Thiodiazotropha endoloripes]